MDCQYWLEIIVFHYILKVFLLVQTGVWNGKFSTARDVLDILLWRGVTKQQRRAGRQRGWRESQGNNQRHWANPLTMRFLDWLHPQTYVLVTTALSPKICSALFLNSPSPILSLYLSLSVSGHLLDISISALSFHKHERQSLLFLFQLILEHLRRRKEVVRTTAWSH